MRGARGRRTALAVRRAGPAAHGVLSGEEPGRVPGSPGADPPGVCRGAPRRRPRTPPVVRRGAAGVVPQRRRRVPRAVAADRGPLVRAAGAGPGQVDGRPHGVGQRLPLAPRLRGARLPAAARLAAHRAADRVDRPDRGRGLRRLPDVLPARRRARRGPARALDRREQPAVARRPGPGRPARPGPAGVAAGAAGARVGAGRRRRTTGARHRRLARRRPGPDAVVPPPRPAGPGCHRAGGRRRARRDAGGGGADLVDGPAGAGHDPAARAGSGRRPRRRTAGCWCRPTDDGSGSPPGAEGLDLDGRGRVWTVLESGPGTTSATAGRWCRCWSSSTSRRLLRGERATCGW